MSSIRSILEDSIHYTLKSSALFPAENPIYANIIDQALKEIEEAIDDIIGENETHWTDHWGEEHNSLTNDMTSKNSLRTEQRKRLKELLK